MGKFRVLFIGDLMCQQNQIAAYKNDFSDVFAGVKEEFAQWDAVVANLETPVAPSMKVCHEPYSFNAPRAFLQAARNAGVSVFLTANNHCLDRGTAGLLETMKEIEAAGGVYVGTRHANGAPYHVLTCGGVRIGLVAFTYGTNAFLNGVYLKKARSFMWTCCKAKNSKIAGGDGFLQAAHLWRGRHASRSRKQKSCVPIGPCTNGRIETKTARNGLKRRFMSARNRLIM